MTQNTPDSRGDKKPKTNWSGPSWLKPGYAFIGSWEPLVFRRRRGGARSDETARYHRERSSESLENMQSVGANLVVIPWDKGFGPTAQEFDRSHSRIWSKSLHEAGLLVGAYIRYDNVVPETMGADVPNLEHWVAITGQGQPGNILHQSYRVAAKPTNEDHIRYVESQIASAITELDADLIHLDGFWMQNLEWADVSEETVTAFRNYLVERYPDPEIALERFGHTRLKAIVPPSFHESDMTIRSVTRVTDPVLQEWLLFRASLTENLAKRFSNLVRKVAADKGKQVAFTANTLIPIGYSNGLYWGFEVERQGPHLDGQWTEDDHWAELRSDGVLVSRIREFKIGRTTGTRVFNYQRATSERQFLATIAQSLAFNDGVIGMLGSPLVAEERYFELKRDAMQWVRENLDALTGHDSAADVVLLRSSGTLTFEATKAHRNVILAEQMLIQGRVSFDIAFDDVFDRLQDYKVLVLADSACMTDGQIASVREFVSGGGSVVALDRTSMYDAWYRLRPRPGLADLFGPDAIYDEGDPWVAPTISIAGGKQVAYHKFGSGRVAYLPAIVTERPADYRGTLGEEPYRFPTEEWQIPLNQPDFLAAVSWARGGLAPANVDVPEGVAMELQRSQTGALVAHLVDYDILRTEPAKVKLSVLAPNAHRAVIHGFWDEPKEVTPRLEDGRFVVELDLSIYAGVVFE